MKFQRVAGELLAGDTLLIAPAGKNREARILREARITSGELTEQKCGTAVGLDGMRMHAIGAEAFAGSFLGRRRGFGHKESLTGGVLVENRREWNDLWSTDAFTLSPLACSWLP